MPWNDDLTGNALLIAASDDSRVRVMAGPGTGKTFALMRKIARLLEQGIEPSRILVVTFTRVSASDIDRELVHLGLPNSISVNRGTLHSLCFRILTRQHVLDFTSRIPRPLLNYEIRFMLEDLSEEPRLGSYNDRKRRLQAFEAAWAREQHQAPGGPVNEIDHIFQNLLLNWLRYHRAILLNELIPLTLNYLRNTPLCDERRQFNFILVDEYQDLNRAEQALIDLLAENSMLTIVGDEDQAIYEHFRYAHPEGITDYHLTHPDTRDILLDMSRRCPPQIVDMANNFIRNNVRRNNRQLIYTGEQRDSYVRIIQWPDMQVESEGISTFITSKIRNHIYQAGDVLILAPRRHIGYEIRDILIQSGIPSRSFFQEESLEGNPKDIDDSIQQQSFTLLALLANPNDRVALRTWLGFGSPSLRKNAYRRLWQYCQNINLSMREALDLAIENNRIIPNISGLVERYQLLRERLDLLHHLEISESLQQLFPENEEWSYPFRTIFNSIERPSTYENIYETMRTNITQPEIPSIVDYVRIMSFHKSKGLTARHVFLVGCVEGLMPSYDLDLPEEQQERLMEEQRRLFYVGITRATHSLVISYMNEIPTYLAFNMRARVRRRGLVGTTFHSQFIDQLGPRAPLAISGAEWLIE